MSLSGEDELIIRKAIAQKLAGVAAVGEVIPSPVYFVERADYFATVAPKLTKKEIELSKVQFCAISFLRFEDDFVEGCPDEPLLNIFYNLHIFRDYDFERADETAAPDPFLKKVLKAEREFINALFGVRQEFLGIQPLTGLPVGITGETNSVVQDDFAEEKQPNRYVDFTDGFSADLVLKIEIKISE